MIPVLDHYICPAMEVKRKSYKKKKSVKAPRMTTKLSVTKVVKSCFTNYFNIPYWQDGGFGTNLTALGTTLQFVFSLTSFRVTIGSGVVQQYGTNLSANFGAIYDRFRMDAVEISIFYNANTSVLNNSASLPILYGVVDTNDMTALSSVNEALSYPDCKIMQMGNSSGSNNGRQTIKAFTPAAEGVITSWGLTSQAANTVKNTWIDTSNTDIIFYGYKMIVDPVVPVGIDTLNGYFTFIVKTHCSFKDQR